MTDFHATERVASATSAEQSAFDAESQRLANTFVTQFPYLIDAGNRNRDLIGREADPGDADDEFTFAMEVA